MKPNIINLTDMVLIPEIPIIKRGNFIQQIAVFNGSKYISYDINPYYNNNSTFGGTFLNEKAIKQFTKILKNVREIDPFEQKQFDVVVSNLLLERFIPIRFKLSDMNVEQKNFGIFEAYCGEVTVGD